MIHSFDVGKVESHQDNQLLLSNKEKDPFIPSEKYLTIYPQSWNNYTRNFDDRLVSLIQYCHLQKPGPKSLFYQFFGYIFMTLGWIITFLTQIENGPSICLFAIVTGQDYLGNWLIVLTMGTAFLAQFPKRFLFRKRPYMEKRAYKIAEDASSSFPSRSAVCGVIYSFAAVYAYNYQVGVINNTPEQSLSLLQCFLFILLGGIIASIARIYMGAHYPSDCIVGILFGFIIVGLSFLANRLPSVFGCPSCYGNSCYLGELETITKTNFELNVLLVNQNIELTLSIILIFTIIQMILNWPPIKFWNKSAPIFGTFAACIAVETLLVCPKDNSQGLAFSNETQVSGYILAFFISLFNVLLVIKTSELYQKIKYTSLQKSLIVNLAIFVGFAVVFAIIVIKVRFFITLSTNQPTICVFRMLFSLSLSSKKEYIFVIL